MFLSLESGWRLREIRNIRKNVQQCASAEPKGTCDLESTNWIFHVVHHVVDISPAREREDDLEHGSGVLKPKK